MIAGWEELLALCRLAPPPGAAAPLEHAHVAWLVALSVAVSAFGAFTAFQLADRGRAARGLARWLWLGCAAVAMGGGGIWSMHFIAMLAFRIAIPVGFDLALTALSLLLAIAFTGIGMVLVALNGMAMRRLLLAAALMGLGISSMHYTGMAAMDMPGLLYYQPALALLSVTIAIGVAAAALWLFFRVHVGPARLIGAGAMALAVSGMHYTAMAAARIAPVPTGPDDVGISLTPLAVAVGAATFVVLVLALVTALIDRHRRRNQHLERAIAERTAALTAANARLTREIAERAAAEAALSQVRDELEARVVERTRAADLARSDAERANAAKTRFLANMTHELRTPLNAVLGFTEALLGEYFGAVNDKQREYLRYIRSSGTHLLALINDVLDLSKIEAGKLEMTGRVFEVATLVTEVAGTCEALMERNRNRFVVEAPPPLGAMRSDPMRLRQVLLNVLGNAAKFTSDGTVTLAVRREASDGVDWLHFAVRDTGIGIAPEHIGRLFQDFTQGDPSISERFGGTGLGLALSQQLARLMGGSITVASRLGEGSEFVVHLPAAQPLAAAG